MHTMHQQGRKACSHQLDPSGIAHVSAAAAAAAALLLLFDRTPQPAKQPEEEEERPPSRGLFSFGSKKVGIVMPSSPHYLWQ
jgi:hypothetical protein